MFSKICAQVARCETVHVRKNGPANQFRYPINYLLLPMMPYTDDCARLFSRNSGNVFSYQDADHGSGDGSATDWVLGWARKFGLDRDAISQVWLLTQPRWFGYVFNPVSFWFILGPESELKAVLVEVNNTYGDRHSYFCMHDDFNPICAGDQLTARKMLHVSPFQDVVGTYTFRFDVSGPRFGVWIRYDRPDSGGLFTSLVGSIEPMSTRALAAMVARRPLGAARVITLIHWQALKLSLKKAGFRSPPPVPEKEVTR